MSFRFFRPWEDDWTPSTCQTPATHHGASAADSATNMPTRVQSSTNTYRDESRSSSEKARNVSQMVPEAHETLSEVRKTHTATMTTMQDEKLKQSLEKMSSSTYSQSVQLITPLPAMQSLTHAYDAVSWNLATAADGQEVWQNDQAAHVTSANKSLLPTAISTDGGASSSPSNTSTAHGKNDILKDTQGNSSGGSKELSALTHPKNLRNSIMLMQRKDTENGARYNIGEHHEQVFISENVSKQEQRHTADKPFKCSLCEKAFPKPQNLHRHARTHSGARPFKCTYCGKVFSQSSHLSRHQRTHSGSKPFKCTACKKAFTKSFNLHTHERIHTGSKPFKCYFCEKAFSDSSSLHKHVRTHTGSKPFKCNFCEKAFSVSSSLHAHERTHTGSKPFKCNFCKKAFSDLSNLQRHVRTHTGSKPFKCNFCGKVFSLLSTLHSHERIHTGSKPFKCQFCEKAFTQSSSLRVHERTHTGIKPFKCTYCDKAFSNSSHLHRHERIHGSSKSS